MDNKKDLERDAIAETQESADAQPRKVDLSAFIKAAPKPGDSLPEETEEERAKREADEKRLKEAIEKTFRLQERMNKAATSAIKAYSPLLETVQQNLLYIENISKWAMQTRLERDEFYKSLEANAETIAKATGETPASIKALKGYMFEVWYDLQRNPDFRKRHNDISFLDLLKPEPDESGEMHIPVQGMVKQAKELREKYRAEGLPDDDLLADNVDALKEAAEIAREEVERNPLAAIPNGDPLLFLMRIINAKSGRLPESSKLNRHEKIKRERDKSKDIVRITKMNTASKSEETVEITNASELFNSKSKGFNKMLTFSMQVMGEQNFPRVVSFPIKRLVDLGMYSDNSNARRAVKDFMRKQKQIEISGSVKHGRKTVRESGGLLFYHCEFDKGYVFLYTNENFNFSFLANYFAVLPQFAYSLGTDAFSLVRYIFFLARQNANKIREGGTFNISMESIREFLGLPPVDEVKNRKYKQFIIDPIEKAIEETEKKISEVPEAKGLNFTITPKNTDTSNIHEYLAGYLEIGLAGPFAQTFIAISEKAEADREKWERAKLKAEAAAAVKEDKNGKEQK